MTAVRSSVEVTDPFVVSNGTKQVCVHASLLSVLYFSVMVETVFENVNEGLRFVFRIIIGFLNQRRLKARTKRIVQTVRHLLFADDCVLLVNTLENMKLIIEKYSRASKSFG